MKRIEVLLATACLSATCFAGTVRDNCGCGIGTMALGEETGILSHVAATILNGLSGNQTFGVSSGTLDCDQSVSLVSVDEVEVFVADNMDHVISDAANGQGMYLAALADLMQIELADRPGFYASVQDNFDTIFLASDASPKGVAVALTELI